MRALSILVALAASLPLSAAMQVPQPADLARQIQAHYDTVKDFQSNFTQTTQGGFMAKAAESQGTVMVKKPGRMRWKYTSGVSQEIVADGKQIFRYVPVDKTVTIEPLPSDAEASTALVFLTGRGDLARDFTAAMPAAQPEGVWHLTLTPKQKQVDFTTLTLIVERATLKFKGLVKTDAQGEVFTFTFPNLRENVGLTDKAFDFVPPPGTHRIR